MTNRCHIFSNLSLWKSKPIHVQDRHKDGEDEDGEYYNEHESKRNGEGKQTYVNGDVYCA